MSGKHFNSGKHSNKKKDKKLSSRKKRIFLLLFTIMLIILSVSFITESDFIKTAKEKNSSDGVDINIPDTMGEYKVLGILTINKIGIEKNILEDTTDASLNLSVTKFYGPELNEIGNFCIAGHNYSRHFRKSRRFTTRRHILYYG